MFLLGNERRPNRFAPSRRGFLRVGAAGLGAGLLGPWLSAARSAAPEYVRDRSVILLFLGGGPSQLETWDPKPGGLDSSTSVDGHLPTVLPGVRFGASFPKLARLADRLTIVRSFQTNHAEHNGAHKQLMTSDLSIGDGKPIKQPGLGPLLARASGAVHPWTGMLRSAVVPPTTRHLPGANGFAGAYDSIVEGAQPAWLGPAYAPLEVKVPMGETTAEGREKLRQRLQTDRDKNGDQRPGFVRDLDPFVADLRIDDRMQLLDSLDRLDREIDRRGVMEGMEQHRRQAVDLLRGGAVREALDLTAEDPRVLAAYDTEHFRNYKVTDDSKFIRNGPSIGISLGRQLLMARRMCEAGCGFVTVVHANWDFHARKGIPNTPEGTSVLAPPLDHALSAFLEDVENRGLSDKILLVVTGEFGRTPKMDDNLGRHHWPRICPLLFAGGGLRHGQVVGQSDRRGGEPATNPVSIADLHATILHALLDVGELRLDPAVPREILTRATAGHPIAELF